MALFILIGLKVPKKKKISVMSLSLNYNPVDKQFPILHPSDPFMVWKKSATD